MTKPALCLHVGQHKTGSSAIQSYLFEHRDTLPGLTYVYRDRPNASLWMLAAFKKDLASLPTYRHKDLGEEHLATVRTRARRRLEGVLSTVSTPRAVLSAESISLFTPEELSELRDFLAPHFSSIAVFQYVRPMKSRLESAFQEKLKHRLARLEDPFTLNYFRRAQVLAEAFGRENLNIFKFDSQLFPRGDVVCHFLEQIGAPLPDASSATDANRGLSLPAVQLLYAYRALYPHPDKRDRAIVRRLAELPGPPFRFHSTLYRRVIGNAPRGVSRFEALAGFSLEEDIYADDAAAVREERDLQDIPHGALAWLAGAVGDAAPASDPASVAQQVAALGQEDLATVD